MSRAKIVTPRATRVPPSLLPNMQFQLVGPGEKDLVELISCFIHFLNRRNQFLFIVCEFVKINSSDSVSPVNIPESLLYFLTERLRKQSIKGAHEKQNPRGSPFG